MIYTKQTKRAYKVSFDAHRNQVDKSDLPYIYHPLHVAEQMEDEISTTVALLHDVIEDTAYTLNDLIKLGFDDEVIEALKYLTRDENIDYFDYIKNIANNKIATKVKLADLEHNMDTTRLDEVTEKDLERVEKYKKSHAFLKEKLKEFK